MEHYIFLMYLLTCVFCYFFLFSPSLNFFSSPDPEFLCQLTARYFCFLLLLETKQKKKIKTFPFQKKKKKNKTNPALRKPTCPSILTILKTSSSINQFRHFLRGLCPSSLWTICATSLSPSIPYLFPVPPLPCSAVL